jgi:hypothetical protein
VKAVETDGDGKFDFGPIKTGHYTLRVDGDQFDGKRSTAYDEINHNRRDSGLPECTGGHEFIVREK